MPADVLYTGDPLGALHLLAPGVFYRRTLSNRFIDARAGISTSYVVDALHALCDSRFRWFYQKCCVEGIPLRGVYDSCWSWYYQTCCVRGIYTYLFHISRQHLYHDAQYLLRGTV